MQPGMRGASWFSLASAWHPESPYFLSLTLSPAPPSLSLATLFPAAPQIIQSENQLLRAGVIEKSFGGIGESAYVACPSQARRSPITEFAQCANKLYPEMSSLKRLFVPAPPADPQRPERPDGRRTAGSADMGEWIVAGRGPFKIGE